jgi:hypothetical protein
MKQILMIEVSPRGKDSASRSVADRLEPKPVGPDQRHRARSDEHNRRGVPTPIGTLSC